jgi:hypothetical protein
MKKEDVLLFQKTISQMEIQEKAESMADTIKYTYDATDSYGMESVFPAHIARAFNSISYARVPELRRNDELPGWAPYPEDADYYTHAEAIEAFASRWGGLDSKILHRAVEKGQLDDQIIALLALAFSGLPEVRELLLTFLASPLAPIRWVSASSLGMMKDERAIPALFEMLLENAAMQGDEESLPGFSNWLFFTCEQIAVLFGEWGPSSVIPVLRQVFVRLWEQEKQGIYYEHIDRYQDALMFALGQRGAFGVVSGLDVSPHRLRLAMISLARGYLRAGEQVDGFAQRGISGADLEREVATVLEDRFGLTREEVAELIRNHASDALTRMQEADAYLQKDE